MNFMNKLRTPVRRYRQFLRVSLTILAASLSLPLAAWAKGGSHTGGGGAFVCRIENGTQIGSAELIDLWEAHNVRKELIAYSDAPVEEQITAALQRLKILDSGMYEVVKKNLDYVKTHMDDLTDPKVDLAPPPDVLTGYRKPNCPPEGMLHFDEDDQRVKRKKETFDKLLTNTDKAAAFTHEAIYKSLGELFYDSNSKRTRKLNALLYQKNPQIPVFDLPALMRGGSQIYHCENAEVNVYAVRGKRFSKPYDSGLTWDLYWLRFGSDVFSMMKSTGKTFDKTSSWGVVDDLGIKIGSVVYRPSCMRTFTDSQFSLDDSQEGVGLSYFNCPAGYENCYHSGEKKRVACTPIQ